MIFSIFLDDSSLRAVSIWIVADVESSKGRELVYTAIKNLVSFKLNAIRKTKALQK